MVALARFPFQQLLGVNLATAHPVLAAFVTSPYHPVLVQVHQVPLRYRYGFTVGLSVILTKVHGLHQQFAHGTVILTGLGIVTDAGLYDGFGRHAIR